MLMIEEKLSVTVKAIQGACLVYNLVMGYDGFSILGKKK
jgi:hypothetical protein